MTEYKGTASGFTIEDFIARSGASPPSLDTYRRQMRQLARILDMLATAKGA